MKIATKAAVASGVATALAAVCSRVKMPGGGCTTSTGIGGGLRAALPGGKIAGLGFAPLADDV